MTNKALKNDMADLISVEWKTADRIAKNIDPPIQEGDVTVKSFAERYGVTIAAERHQLELAVAHGEYVPVLCRRIGMGGHITAYRVPGWDKA